MITRQTLMAATLPLALLWQTEVRADAVADCAVVMGKEVPTDTDAELHAGCTCQLAYIKSHVAQPDYVFWTQQLAIMGSKTMEDAERNQLLLRLLGQRGVPQMMNRIANAAQAALEPCRLDSWNRTR